MAGENPLGKSVQLLVFKLYGQRYALYISAVERVVRMVEITPLPKAPEIVLGVVNLRGRIVPVVDMRKRFRLPEKEAALNDRLIVAKTSRRTVAFAADEVSGVVECPSAAANEVIASEKILPGIEYVEGVVKMGDGLILIHDLDKFLSLDEERELDKALG